MEWGYNRDNESLPQINLGIVYTEQTNFPLYYQIYPGSIPDVNTLKNILIYLEMLELKETVFVLDRGFYSASNLLKIKDSNIEFVIPLSRSVKIFSSLLSDNKRNLSNPTNLFIFKDEVLFHVRKTISINDELTVEAHVFLNEQKRSEKACRFFKKIVELELSIKKEKFKRKNEAFQYLSDHLPGSSNFFHVTIENGIADIKRKPRNISDHASKLGAVIIITNCNSLSRESILALYRRKDYVERIFDVLKNELDGKRLRSNSREVIEGRLFVKFLSLILYSGIQNNMRSEGMYKKYSIKEIIYELKKLKIINMSNNKSHLTETTKRQKSIYEKFSMEVPSCPPPPT